MSLIRKLFKYYLQKTGKKYLTRFVDGLNHLGRPASVFFPPELLEQGLSLVLTGLNNTLAIQSNLNWIWPYWVEQQKKPEAIEFIPTGVNVLTQNLSRRNWTSIGIPGSRKEAMVDPVGMVTLEPFGWSIIPYLRFETSIFVPPLLGEKTKQHRISSNSPVITTEYSVTSELTWHSEICPLLLEGDEVVQISQFVTNKTTTSLSCCIGFAIRPYNVLTVGHINKLKFKNNLWRVNRKPGLLLIDKPSRYHLSDRKLGDPLHINSQATLSNHSTVSSHSGIVTGVSEYDFDVSPGETVEIHSLGVIGKHNEHPNSKFQGITKKSLKEGQNRANALWAAVKEEGLTISIPDKHLEEAFYSVKCHLHVFDDGDRFTPGTFFYHDMWVRDTTFIALAFINLGFFTVVERKLRTMLNRQDKTGYVRSQNGEWDSNGQALFILLYFVKTTGNLDLLKEFYPKILKAIQWIEEQVTASRTVKTPHYGLLPAGISAEHFGPNDHYYWDNFWALAGIKAAIEAATLLHKQDDLDRLQKLEEVYHTDINNSLFEASAKNANGAAPASPYRHADCASIGNLIAFSPLDIFPADTHWIKPTIQKIYTEHIHKGLFFQKIIHTGLNPYLSVQLARVLLYYNDHRWKDILKGILTHASGTYTWPEAIHPRTGGGCMGDGDHGWAASEILNLIRELFVVQREGHLWIGGGIENHWFTCEHDIVVKNLHTPYGTLNLQWKTTETETLFTWSVKYNNLQNFTHFNLIIPQKHFLRESLYSVENHEDFGLYTSVKELSGSLIFTRQNGPYS